MGVMRLSPDSKVVVDDYLAAYGSEQYGAELARRGRVLTWGLNLAFLWVLAMVGSGFGLVLAGWQVVGVTLAVTPMVLAMVLVVRLRIEQRAGRGPSGWG
jgi:hypothetical protein